MATFKPEELILRCYGCKTGDKPFVGVCIDLNIAVQAESQAELRQKMNNAIVDYIDTVLDTEDKSSIPSLIYRRAPMRDFLIYYLIKIVVYVRQFPSNFIFKEYIPFHLSHGCG
jgi:hypothetical protein